MKPHRHSKPVSPTFFLHDQHRSRFVWSSLGLRGTASGAAAAVGAAAAAAAAGTTTGDPGRAAAWAGEAAGVPGTTPARDTAAGEAGTAAAIGLEEAGAGDPTPPALTPNETDEAAVLAAEPPRSPVDMAGILAAAAVDAVLGAAKRGRRSYREVTDVTMTPEALPSRQITPIKPMHYKTTPHEPRKERAAATASSVRKRLAKTH